MENTSRAFTRDSEYCLSRLFSFASTFSICWLFSPVFVKIGDKSFHPSFIILRCISVCLVYRMYPDLPSIRVLSSWMLVSPWISIPVEFGRMSMATQQCHNDRRIHLCETGGNWQRTSSDVHTASRTTHKVSLSAFLFQSMCWIKRDSHSKYLPGIGKE